MISAILISVKYKIPIRLVIQNPERTLREDHLEAAYEEQEAAGVLVNSGEFSGLSVTEAKARLVEFIRRRRVRSSHGELSPPGLGGLASTLLGNPDSDCVLRSVWDRAGPIGGSSGGIAKGCALHRERRLAAVAR